MASSPDPGAGPVRRHQSGRSARQGEEDGTSVIADEDVNNLRVDHENVN